MDNTSDLEAAGRARREAAAHSARIARDPASDMRESSRASLHELAAEVRGADPAVDAALKDLLALESSAVRELEEIAAGAEEVARGRKPIELLRSRVEDVSAEADRQYAAASRAAESALATAQEAIIGTLLPEPPLDAAAQLKADTLEKLLKANRLEARPIEAFDAVFRDLDGRADRLGIALLLGEWGRATYLAAGGDPKSWGDVRRAFARAAAQSSLKESPVAKRLRVLYSPSVRRATSAANAQAHSAVTKLRRERERLRFEERPR